MSPFYKNTHTRFAHVCSEMYRCLQFGRGLLVPAVLVHCDDSKRTYVGTHQYVANRRIEDRVGYTSAQKVFFLTVLDGHGGFQLAEYLNRRLPQIFFEKYPNLGLKGSMREAFTFADSEWFDLVKPMYDIGFTGPIKVGACCVAVAVDGHSIVVGSVGDCKCVLARRQNGPINLNPERNANLESEQARLRSLFPNDLDIVRCKRSWQESVQVPAAWWKGGTRTSTVTRHSGCYVKGRLQPTKSFGDFHLKSVIIDPERNRPFLESANSLPYIDSIPDISVTPRCFEDDLFLIVATDGLWDQFTSEEAVEIVSAHLKAGFSPEQAAAELVEAALMHAANQHQIPIQEMKLLPPGSARRNLHDDISVCIVDLQNLA